ncbi:MAG TPA: hypothetical protein VFO42_00865 [Sphingomicrobium sp.]|nr:hypothetical protein [Sphingomicrobium sp.]
MQWGVIAGMSGIAAVTAVAVSGPEVRRYAIPESVARERLAAAPLPETLLGMAGHRSVLIREDGALVWNLGGPDNRSVGRVTLEGEGASTNVTVSFDLSDTALGDSPLSKTRLTRSMAESMFAEHVDSVLSGRPFDAQRSMMVTAQEIQSNPEVMREYGQALGDQFNEVANVINETSEYSSFPPRQPDGRDAVEPNRESYQPTTIL